MRPKALLLALATVGTACTTVVVPEESEAPRDETYEPVQAAETDGESAVEFPLELGGDLEIQLRGSLADNCEIVAYSAGLRGGLVTLWYEPFTEDHDEDGDLDHGVAITIARPDSVALMVDDAEGIGGHAAAVNTGSRVLATLDPEDLADGMAGFHVRFEVPGPDKDYHTKNQAIDDAATMTAPQIEAFGNVPGEVTKRRFKVTTSYLGAEFSFTLRDL